jgi:2-keto-4-pentenoate hydratase/2-oxohepta-3-ene-1,7-dioic acid hydratase in catechol pathway
MRLISFSTATGPRVGAQLDDGIVDLTALGCPSDLGEILAASDGLTQVKKVLASANNAPRVSAAGLTYLPLIRRPGKIICLGLNYADHAKEGGHARPEHPSFFMRGATSTVAHGAPMIRPQCSDKFDYEAELAVVIGKKARHLTPTTALDCVAGYTCFNDGSIRDYQRKGTQWTLGKNFDGTGAFGPALVTPDELPAGAAGLRVQSRLNGNIMQDANTNDFLWNVTEALCIIAECMTLEPGDVIITGTPAGVGYARTPPVFMKAGDTIEIEVERVGLLRNVVKDDV